MSRPTARSENRLDWDASVMLGQYCSVPRHKRPSASGQRHRAFVTAPMRGPGLDKLKELAEVVHEPWTDQQPLKLYDGAGLAKRLAAEDADIAVVEADFVDGPVFDLPLVAVAATRGDPNNVAVRPGHSGRRAGAAHPWAATPTQSPNLPSACSSPSPAGRPAR